MSLSDQYRRQRQWRSWPRVFDALPSLSGALVFDLGCAIGDQTAELIARGARVIGFDMNEELLEEARARDLPDAVFLQRDLRALPEPLLEADGIWCSFVAAYFTELDSVLSSWREHLRTGGWIVLTEVDDLFAHEPVSDETRSLLDACANDALAAGRFDFRMGHKIGEHLRRAGFVVTSSFVVEDQELSFAGAATPAVLDAWRLRLERMQLLRSFCGERFAMVQRDLVRCMTLPEHVSNARVHCWIARSTK